MATITIDLAELRTLLTRIVPFAADPGMYGGALPVIESVYLQGRGDFLIASATDRYVLGVTRTRIEGAAGFEALLKVRDVKHILATFKARKGIVTKVMLTRDGGTADGTLAVTLADGLFAEADDLTAKYGLVDGQFPKTHELFTKWEPPTEPAGIGYNAKYLAKFAHVTSGRGEPIKITGGGDRTTIVQAGDYFLGAIMPVRLTDTLISDVSDWNSMYAEPKPAPKAAAKSTRARKAVA